MANHRAVTLNVSAKEKVGEKWKSVVASDNKTTFWFKFTGGNVKAKDNGDQEGDVSKIRDTFRLNLKRLDGDDDEYDIVGFEAGNDPHDQLSGTLFNDGKRLDVENRCDFESLEMIYWVNLKPVHNNITFKCHPVISNKQHTITWLELLVRLAKRVRFYFLH